MLLSSGLLARAAEAVLYRVGFLKKVSYIRESRIERASETSWAVASSIFLIVACLTEDVKFTFLLNGLAGEHTYSKSARYVDFAIEQETEWSV
jgi:ribosomal silencing factor RsfS